MTKSGLVLPVEKPKKVKHPKLELQNEEDREKAIEAFRLLWDACGLYKGDRGITLNSSYQAHRQAWEYFATMLVGDDRPEGEVWC